MKAIVNGTVISRGKEWSDHAVVFDEKIRAIVPTYSVQDWPIQELIDAQGLFVAPGLIDIHIHGCCGFDTMDATPESLNAMATCLVERGVTSFLPTTMAADWEQLGLALANIRQATGEKAETEGVRARVLGAHLEGPFLNPEFRGAHAADYLLLPSWQPIAEFMDVIRIITLAPELPGSRDFLEQLRAFPQVVAAMGHTGASLEEARTAIGLGISHATHLFNAMRPLHHRQPGALGAVLTSGLSAELIADNLHVHPSIYALLLKTQGPDALILISDSMRAAGLGEGEYELGGQRVQVTGGAARLSDGTLAGSVICLNQAVVNFCRATHCSMAEAIGLASRNPARLLGLQQQIGDLAVGMEADIIIMDRQGQVRRTFVAGRG